MFNIQKTADGAFSLSGDLTLDEIKAAERQLRPLFANDSASLCFNGAGLQKIDTAGALILAQLRRKVPALRLEGFSSEHTSLIALIEKANPTYVPPHKQGSVLRYYVEKLGFGTISAIEAGKGILAFFGQVVVFILKDIRHPRLFRMDSLARHIQETGIDAMPIVCLVAFLISIVLAYQGAFALRPLGAEIFTVNLMVLSVLREMGVLLTAIMVAGRSGSAFAAEIGVMKVNEEVDALSMIGIQPFNMLVMPRIFALLITLPLLTFMADVVGLFGGSVTCAFMLDISWQQYWEQVRHVAQGHHFIVGIIKAPVFALIISIVGCRFGMQVTGSAESVGAATTRSVVESIFIVLVADALFSIMFSKMGW